MRFSQELNNFRQVVAVGSHGIASVQAGLTGLAFRIRIYRHADRGSNAVQAAGIRSKKSVISWRRPAALGKHLQQRRWKLANTTQEDSDRLSFLAIHSL